MRDRKKPHRLFCVTKIVAVKVQNMVCNNQEKHFSNNGTKSFEKVLTKASISAIIEQTVPKWEEVSL